MDKNIITNGYIDIFPENIVFFQNKDTTKKWNTEE